MPGNERASAPSGALAALALVTALAGVATPAAVRASCCVFEDPLSGVSDAAGRGRSLRLGLDAEALSSRAAMEGMDGLEEIRQHALRVTAVYTARDRVNAVLALPLVQREWAGHGHSTHERGLGDVDVGVRVAVWRRASYVSLAPPRWVAIRAQAVALSAGTSLPTGANDLRHDGVRLDEHAQLGTGAFGPYVRALYRLQQEPWAIVASATGRIRTRNDHGYRAGRGLFAGAELQRSTFDWLSVGGGLDLRWASADVLEGAPVANSGGALLSIVASASVRVTDGVAFRVRTQVPAATRLRGDQRPGPVVAAGVQLDLG